MLDGEVVGTLDARFRQTARQPGEFALGGATWSVVKCDESHNLVVVIPVGIGNGTSRVFWTAGEETALSPVICGAVQRIVARGGTDLPLGEKETVALGERSIPCLPGLPGGASLSGRSGAVYGKEVVVYRSTAAGLTWCWRIS